MLRLPAVPGRAVTLPERIVALHLALDGAGVPHAFGGALALAWCTQRARGTVDIDLNLFVPPSAPAPRWKRSPPAWRTATPTSPHRRRRADPPVVGHDPVDVFFSTTPFHEEAAGRARLEPFLGVDVPFLACRDLAVFKAFFDRTRDWADLEDMAAAGTLDVEAVLGVVVRHLGGADHRVERLRSLAR